MNSRSHSSSTKINSKYSGELPRWPKNWWNVFDRMKLIGIFFRSLAVSTFRLLFCASARCRPMMSELMLKSDFRWENFTTFSFLDPPSSYQQSRESKASLLTNVHRPAVIITSPESWVQFCKNVWLPKFTSISYRGLPTSATTAQRRHVESDSIFYNPSTSKHSAWRAGEA